MGKIVRKLGWCILSFSLVMQTGCLLAVAGAAAGAGAAGYLYLNGLLYRDYHANLGDAVAAVRTSLVELQFPLLKEKNETGSAYFQSQTGDGQTVRIYLEMVPSPIPSEGAVTRIGVRVGFSGDELVSSRILDQVGKHLVRPNVAIPSVNQPVTPLPAASTPKTQTEPPLLATDRLTPVPAERLTPVASTPK